MQVGVYGSGYLATIVSACLADFGVPVTCVDEERSDIASAAACKTNYFEKNLQEMVRRNVRSGRLTFSTELGALARKSQIIYLTGECDQNLETVAVRLARMCVEPVVLVLAATCPVGTGEAIARKVADNSVQMTVVSHPLFLTDGCAIEDFNWPDRIVLGTSSFDAIKRLKELYRPLVMRGVPVIVTSHSTAELTRQAQTAFLATKISFINELARLCERVGGDGMDLALALGLDKKIGPRCLQPGAGFGGRSAEAEMQSLSALARDNGVTLSVLSAAREVNQRLCERILDKLNGSLESLAGKQVALLGLAYKPNTDSVASSSSLMLAKQLVAGGVDVQAFDPAAMRQAKSEFNGKIKYCDNAYAAAEGADALILGTAWPEFRTLDFMRIKRLLRRPVVIDPRNLLDANRLRGMGYDYAGLGRM